MNEEKFLELTTKYLSKEASNEEIEKLQNLLKDEECNRLFNFISSKWNSRDMQNDLTEFNIGRGLGKLTSKIRRYEPTFEWEEKKKERSFIFQSTFLRIAASVAFLLMLATGSLYLIGVLNQKTVSISWNEKTTMMGEKSIVTLLDGTKITLNADSKLKYPAHFGEDSREVYLKGEAYFNIMDDPSKPFVVHTGNLSTTVLGTKFNVSAFPDEKNIAISLVEGSVKISKEVSGTVENIVILQPEQQLLYNKEKMISTVEQFDIQETVGWKENVLIFRKEPFKNVLIKLERVYGIKFELTDKSFGNRKIMANFQNESVWTISETLKKLTGLQYKTIKENNETKRIVFFKK